MRGGGFCGFCEFCGGILTVVDVTLGPVCVVAVGKEVVFVGGVLWRHVDGCGV